MVKRKNNCWDWRRLLGSVLFGLAAFTGVMAIVFLVKFIAFGNSENGFFTACALATTMLFGALMSAVLGYTIRVPRRREDDKNQLIAGAIMSILGVAICASMHIIFGIGDYGFLSVIYYAQSAVILVVCIIALGKN